MLMPAPMCVKRNNKDVVYLLYSRCQCLLSVLSFAMNLGKLFYSSFVLPVVQDVAMPSGDTGVELCSKPTPPKLSGPAPSAVAPAAAVHSPPPKDEGKKKKQEKKGAGYRGGNPCCCVFL